MKSARLVVSLLGLACMVTACGSGDEPYKAAPAWSGRKPALPPVPALKSSPIKVGDAYTVHGAIHHLRSRLHDKEVTAKDITIQGYIVESNIENAPECAIHKAGQKDKDDCQSDIPSFWISDSKTPGKDDPKIRVLGFAKNFASVFEAMNKYKGLKDPPKELYKDEIWSVDVPYPLPAVGAKVKITGHYGYTFGKSSTGIVSDPVNGVATYGKIEYVEQAPNPASFKNKKI